MAEYTIGLDLGGTNLRAAAIDRSGTHRRRHRRSHASTVCLSDDSTLHGHWQHGRSEELSVSVSAREAGRYFLLPPVHSLHVEARSHLLLVGGFMTLATALAFVIELSLSRQPAD